MGTNITRIKGLLQINSGVVINNISSDDTLVGDSDLSVVTEKAIKAYVDAHGGGVTDHGALTGLADDDHTQYHTDTRGDARYLYRENTVAFTPDGDYEPATKKYVDDLVPDLSTSVDDFTIKYVDSKLKIADRIEANIMLNAFRIAINGGLSQFNMVDGITDEYEDESGIDTVNSLNEDYDSSNDLYKPTSQLLSEIDYMEYADDTTARSNYVVNNTGTIKLLSHFDGADGDTFSRDYSKSGHTMIFNNNAQLDTAQYKWGTSSLLFDGTNDYVSIIDSADWDLVGSNTDSWTIDFFVKHTDHVGIEQYIGQNVDATHYWKLIHEHGNGLKFVVYDGSEIITTTFAGEITDTDWHHIALIKVADEYGIYLGGTQVSYVKDSSIATFVASLLLGASEAPADYFSGHIDDIRITNNNAFDASPNSTLDDTITVPTAEHILANIKVYSENTIKTQGSYSLKVTTIGK